MWDSIFVSPNRYLYIVIHNTYNLQYFGGDSVNRRQITLVCLCLCFKLHFLSSTPTFSHQLKDTHTISISSLLKVATRKIIGEGKAVFGSGIRDLPRRGSASHIRLEIWHIELAGSQRAAILSRGRGGQFHGTSPCNLFPSKKLLRCT